MSDVWTKWEGHVVDGAFPLRRYLGGSDHGGVFLTEHPAQNLPNAALKLVPAIPTLAESQLAHWNVAANLDHPHLIRLFGTGRCRLGSLHCLYVVMEYAEQNLAQLLPNRALTDAEVREMLPPVLDTLAFLHSRDLVQGQLKPSNILVVADRLKLASDTIRPAGEATASLSMSSAYDPPEARDGSSSTAGDIWALGVTLFEALRQSAPSRPDERSHGVVLPPDFPPAFSEVIGECLSRRPVDRPGVTALRGWVDRGFRGPAILAPAVAPAPARAAGETTSPPPAQAEPRAGQPPAGEPPGRLVIRAVVDRGIPPQEPRERRRSFLPLIAGAVAIVAVCWAGIRMFMSHPNSSASTVDVSQPSTQSGSALADSAAQKHSESPSTPAGTSAPLQPSAPRQASAPPQHGAASQHSAPSQAAAPPSNTNAAAPKAPSVVHEEVPVVPRSALATIHGHVRVAVLVTVDESGAVISDTLADPGPSRYFARIATEAARKWKFSPAQDHASRHWLVRFEFSPTGTTARAVTSTS
jgi:TonB family protein